MGNLKGKAKELEEDITGYALRDSRYRLVEWTKGFKTYMPFDESKVVAYELYDYNKDPEERHNVANDPAYASVVKNLKKKLHQYYAKSYSSPMSAPIAKTAAGE